MELLPQAFRALLVAGLPLFVLAFALVGWALYRGRVQGESFADLQKNLAALAGQGKDENGKKIKRKRTDPALEKWFRFGGNFYGMVALYTWLRIELVDVLDFLAGVGSLVISFDLGALISLLINLFIESIMNFVWAISWPMYWMSRAQPQWLWILVAYGGYWLGVRAAQRVAGRRWLGDEPDLGGVITGRDDEAGEEADSAPAKGDHEDRRGADRTRGNSDDSA